MGFAKTVAILVILAIILAAYSMSFSLIIAEPTAQKWNPACWIAKCEERNKRIIVHVVDGIIILICVGIMLAITNIPF